MRAKKVRLKSIVSNICSQAEREGLMWNYQISGG